MKVRGVGPDAACEVRSMWPLDRVFLGQLVQLIDSFLRRWDTSVVSGFSRWILEAPKVRSCQHSQRLGEKKTIVSAVGADDFCCDYRMRRCFHSLTEIS